MSTFNRVWTYSWLLLLFSIGANALQQDQVASNNDIASVQPTQPAFQGQCGTFVTQCYKTCFGLGQVRVAYACTLSNGVYGAHCGCGSTDETDVVLSLASIQTTVTATLQTTATDIAVVTATSTASSTTTTITTVQTSVCSYATIASTVLVTRTITTRPTVVTTFTTATVSSAQAGVFTSAVPGAVVSSGTLAKRKRGTVSSISFCNDVQVACKVGCAASWSTPAVQYCQANAQTFSIACICKNNVNVVQQVIQAFNLLRPASQRYTSIATTQVTATVTATATSVATVVVTSKVTVVPTTVVSVYTSVVSATSTYACYTTIPTTSVVTNVFTPTTTTTSTTTTTVVTAVATRLYYAAVSVYGQAAPSYVAQALTPHREAQAVGDIDSAQVFAILQSTPSDTLYSLFGVGPGDFQGSSLGGQNNLDTEGIDYFDTGLISSITLAQGPAMMQNAYEESAIWQIDLLSLAMQVVWTRPAGSSPPTAILQGAIALDFENSLNAFRNDTNFFDGSFTPVSFSLVPV